MRIYLPLDTSAGLNSCITAMDYACIHVDDAMAKDAGPTHGGPAEASSASLDDKSRYKVFSPTIRDLYDVTSRYAK